MPGRGWGSGRGGMCPRRITRFVEPCLLLLLKQNTSHGYTLLEKLERFGFDSNTLDASIVYRALRQMEASSWVTSEWDTEGSGPPRRMYEITEDGRSYLAQWIDDLRRTRDEIDRFIQAYSEGTLQEEESA